MPWFKIKHHNGKTEYQFHLSENELVFRYLEKQQWYFDVNVWSPKKLDYKSLLTFYQEIQSGLQSGLQLNQAIAHLSMSSTHNNISNINAALLSELEKGVTFNEALIKLTTPSASPYCHLVNAKGSREDCEQSLVVSIKQLETLLNWSKRLLKTLYYPFSIIQIALIILIANQFLQSASATETYIETLKGFGMYLSCTLMQLFIMYQLYKGNACNWLEKRSRAFRLTKLFSLLSSARKTGKTFQQSLKSMPDYFHYKPIQIEILEVYYKLQLGSSYEDSFPKHWFPKESSIALYSSGRNGDIERALLLASNEHEKHWLKHVSLLEKIIPAVCLFVAGGFVASALVALYAPLLEVQ